MGRPSRNQITEELDALQSLIERHSTGLSRHQISELWTQRLERHLPERTLSRRLETLVDQNRIRSVGAGPAVVYQPVAARVSVAPSSAADSDYVPLSSRGEEVRLLVRRPISQRTPVGYDSKFLESYIPGQTWYLLDDQRQRLHERGRTPDETKAAGTYAREIYNRLLIDLAWASSHLEGNTYSRLDTQNLLEFGQRAEGKDAAEAQMVLNHKAAIAMLVDQA
ncbi:MAG TPA: hypothetical protein VK807_22830, partial [Gemmatimonadaceae bacterium]|nr:hypothetical protein [Gemmatimonadaceae bacterium]